MSRHALSAGPRGGGPRPATRILLLTAGLASLAAPAATGCAGRVDVDGESTTSSGTATATDTADTTDTTDTSTGTASSTGSTTGENTPCFSGKGTELVTDGAYFFLLDFSTPTATQIQLFADVRVDGATGAVLAQLTNADRNPDPDICPFPCDPDEVCRLVPEPECVAPSEKAGSPGEYSDFVVEADAPKGYTLTVTGCVEDTGEGVADMVTDPATLEIPQPVVTLFNLVLTCELTIGPDGALGCSGILQAPSVLLGNVNAGSAEGTVTGRRIPPGEEPEGLPAPPE